MPATAPSLARLRNQLTLWYAGVLLCTLALLGVGLFVAIRRQLAHRLDASLRAATTELIHAAHIRELESSARSRRPVVDAIDELHIPDRALYLLAVDGTPIKPAVADLWIRDAARTAGRLGRVDLSFETPADRDVRLHAERFAGAGGTAFVAAVVADRLELEDQYASLIRAFAIASLVALLLVAGGGYVLVSRSTAPAERSMQHLRQLMADAAHELRTPITVLRSRAEVALQQERAPGEYRATLRSVAQEAERLGTIVGDLLTLARADAGERPVARERLFLDDVALEVAEAARALAVQRGLTLDVGRFEEAAITGDPLLVRQLLMIVIDNAIKFTPPGGRIQVDVAADHGPMAAVEDSGVGIPEAQLPHVFDRFYRGDGGGGGEGARGGSGRTEGAGLGLAIAKWIADEHGARIEIRSTPGRGTRVTITFPSPAVRNQG